MTSDQNCMQRIIKQNQYSWNVEVASTSQSHIKSCNRVFLHLKKKARWNEESKSDMARGKCLWNFSYNNTTLLLSFFSVAVLALFVFHSLYASLSIHSTNVSPKGKLTNTNLITNPNTTFFPSRQTNCFHVYFVSCVFSSCVL